MFLGTPVDAVPTLDALVDAGFEIVLVVTMPDRRRGRGSALIESPVKQAALRHGIEVTSDTSRLLTVEADLGVVVAFGRIITNPVLEALPMVNLHFSLLPRWRGAAPVERAILAGDEVTGVCVMALAPELDTGDVHASAELAIGATATATELRAELASVGADLMVRTLSDGLADPSSQVGEATYARKIEPADLELDFVRSAAELDRIVRVGGAWTTFRGERFKIWRTSVSDADPTAAPGTIGPNGVVATGSGGLQLEIVQPAGRARTDAGAWLNGARLGADDRLGS